MQHYLALHGEAIRRQFGFDTVEAFVPALRARLYRTQFGFLTEYHAYLLASVVFGTENMHRSVALDKAGVDFQVGLAGQVYNLHVFVDNERAWGYRRYKSAHKNVDAVAGVHVNLPYALVEGRFNSVAFLPNGFGIYRDSYLRYFEAEVRNGNIRNNNIVGTRPDGFVYKA